MRKGLFVLMVLLLVACIGLASCAKPAPTEIKPVDLKLTEVTPILSAVDNVAYTLTFVVSNPNEFDVTLDSFNYFMSSGDVKLSGSQIAYPIYIPTGKEARVTGFFVFPFSDILMGKILGQGLAAGAAMAASLPFWKSIGGKLPNPALQEVWDKATADKLTFTSKGTAYVSGAGMHKSQNFELPYKAP